MNPRNPNAPPVTHGDRIRSDLKRTIKGVWDAFTSPEEFFDTTDPARADEPIISGAECETCGDAPLCRADGLQVRCPTCHLMHAPRGAKEIPR